jgi:hypothetical protein
MTFAYTQDVPIDEGVYRKIVDGIGPEVPPGMVAHLAVKLPEGGLRYIDVWDSEEDWDRFEKERLNPVLVPIIEEALGHDGPPPPAPRELLDVVHAWAR